MFLGRPEHVIKRPQGSQNGHQKKRKKKKLDQDRVKLRLRCALNVTFRVAYMTRMLRLHRDRGKSFLESWVTTILPD